MAHAASHRALPPTPMMNHDEAGNREVAYSSVFSSHLRAATLSLQKSKVTFILLRR